MDDSEDHRSVGVFGREVDAVWELREKRSAHRLLDERKLHRVFADAVEYMTELSDKSGRKDRIAFGVPVDRVADVSVGLGRNNDLRHCLGSGRELAVQLSANLSPRPPCGRIISERDEPLLNEFTVPSGDRDSRVRDHGIP